MKKLVAFILLLMFYPPVVAQDSDYISTSNINYYTDSINRSDSYISKRCVLDLYYPKTVPSFATVIWFHGGGLSGGQKEIPEALKQKGVAIVAVNYRLYPKVKAPT